MWERIKRFFAEETPKALFGAVVALALSSVVAYFAWEEMRAFLTGSHALNNTLGLLVYLLAALGVVLAFKKLRPGQPGYFKYDKDYLDGMLWMWNWRLDAEDEAALELGSPKCAKCMMELEPVLADDDELLYYCQDRHCGAVYKTGFKDDAAYRQFIIRKITQYVLTGKYRQRMKKKYPTLS